MMNRNEVISFLSSHRQELEECFGVSSLALFGSIARDEAGPESDVAEAEEPRRERLTGVVAELAGVIKNADIGEPRAEYTEYLLKKYS